MGGRRSRHLGAPALSGECPDDPQPGRPRYRAATDVERAIAVLGIGLSNRKASRHSVSALVQGSGHTLKAPQELLSHATSSTTHRVYTHTSSDTMDRIADALQAIFGDVDVDIPDPDDVIFDERGPEPRKPAAASQKKTHHVPIAHSEAHLRIL